MKDTIRTANQVKVILRFCAPDRLGVAASTILHRIVLVNHSSR